MSLFMQRGRRPFVLAFVLLAAAGCSQSPSVVTDPAPSALTATVQVVTPQRQSIKRTISQPGSIQSYEQTPIFAKIPGYVEKWRVDIGDEVCKGDLLAELWIPEVVSELNVKKQQVEQAKKALALATKQVATARAQLKEAEAARSRAESNNDYWKGQSERFAKLVTQNVLEKQTQEDALNQYRSATAALTEAQAKVGSATALLQEKEIGRDKSEIDIKAADAEKQRQADMVRYATFIAPYDGVVTRRTINTFDFVQPPTGGKGEPLYVVERRDLMRIFVEVPEADAVWVRKDATAHVRIPALQGREFSGKVARTSYALDRMTRTLLAEIDLANPKDELRPGMYAYATIEAHSREVLTLPASAVVTEGDVNVGYRTYCYLVDNGRVKRVLIETGARNGELVEVLKKQVAAAGAEPRWEAFAGAEQVAKGDLSGLKDGQEVHPAQK
jgi:HlyD family secretion protein